MVIVLCLLTLVAAACDAGGWTLLTPAALPIILAKFAMV
jgi:fumarate reductase subunit C